MLTDHHLGMKRNAIFSFLYTAYKPKNCNLLNLTGRHFLLRRKEFALVFRGSPGADEQSAVSDFKRATNFTN